MSDFQISDELASLIGKMLIKLLIEVEEYRGNPDVEGAGHVLMIMIYAFMAKANKKMIGIDEEVIKAVALKFLSGVQKADINEVFKWLPKGE